MAREPDDLDALEKAVNDASGKAGALWLSFVTAATLVLITTGTVTHKKLFLEEALRLPVLNVDLPLLGYFFFAPLFFVVFHFYLLLQLDSLAARVRTYDRALHAQQKLATSRLLLRSRIDSFIFAQVLVGARERREGAIGRLNRLAAWITIVALPVGTLLAIQIVFLPYHGEALTWWHRVLIALDLALLWFFWRRLTTMPNDWRAPLKAVHWSRWAVRPLSSAYNKLYVLVLGRAWRDNRHEAAVRNGIERFALRVSRASFGPTVAILVFSVLVAVYPTETIYEAGFRRPFADVTRVVFQQGAMFNATGEDFVDDAWSFEWLGSNRLLLADHEFDVAARLKKIEGEDGTAALNSSLGLDKRLEPRRTVRLNFRDLSFARLDRVDLRQADFSSATMVGVNLSNARLERAKFTCDPKSRDIRDYNGQCPGVQLQGADLTGSKLLGANLARAQLEDASLFKAEMQGADLRGAALSRANLTGARLNNSIFRSARLRDSFLKDAQMRGADFRFADLRGADLNSAQFQEVRLDGAMLQGASLKSAVLQGASLKYAELAGADLKYAQLQGADLRRASLIAVDLTRSLLNGANLQDALLQGAILREAVLDGADLERAVLQGADLREASMKGANLRDADVYRALCPVDDGGSWIELFKWLRLTPPPLPPVPVLGEDGGITYPLHLMQKLTWKLLARGSCLDARRLPMADTSDLRFRSSDSMAYQELIRAVFVGVPDKARGVVIRRLNVLSPGLKRRFTRDHRRWSLEKQRSGNSVQSALAICRLICRAELDVVRGVIRNGRLASLGGQNRDRVYTLMRNAAEGQGWTYYCPIGKQLTEKDWEEFRSVAALYDEPEPDPTSPLKSCDDILPRSP